MIGRSIGHFQVTAKLGAGGMGEVYLATDTRLGRPVAIKVLPAAFTADPERLRRFEREAQLLALLSHPHIAAIYGMERVEQAGEGRPAHALIMELVDGPTLADEIARGPMSLERALPIARQLAEALEYAHDRGIVHRDLKPANIKLSADRQVKILDFGLAKANDPAAAGDVANSPTQTISATQAGVILGTAAYMAPEQAKGLPVDRRADIWAFGAVVYEMLTGRRSYDGDSVTELLAAVMRDEPDWTALPAATPRRVRDLLARCQIKDPRRRLQAIGEARIVLDDAIANPKDDAAAVAPVAAEKSSRWMRSLPWAIAGILAVTTAARWAPATSVAPAVHPLRLSVKLSSTASIVPALPPAVVWSPDGTIVAFRGRVQNTDKPRIFLRRLDQTDAVPLAGTDDVTDIFFSRDGDWIAFVVGTVLKKIRVTGGDAVPICDVGSNFRGGSWTDDGHILYATSRSAILRVPADGGTPEPITKLDEAAGEITHRQPQFLPGANAVLFTAHTNSVNYDDAGIMVQPLGSGTPKLVLRGGFAARYVPSGHLLYLHESTLFAVPFDLTRLETTGSAVRVVEGVANVVGSAGAQFSVSESGALAYLPTTGTSNAVPIVWLSAGGAETPVRPPGSYLSPKFSPDGRQLLLQVFDRGQSKINVYDLERDVMSRLTNDAADEQFAVWTADGKGVVFSSDREGAGKTHLYLKRVGSDDPALRLTDAGRTEREKPGGWTLDGKTLVYSALNDRQNAEWDILALRLDGDATSGWKPQAPAPLLNSTSNETSPVFSPDGRWLAYVSNESGSAQVFVRRYPELDGKVQISTDGGERPVWSKSTSELLYSQGNRAVMAVSYAPAGGEFHPGKPRVWTEIPRANLDGVRNFDIHPDGKRLVLLKAPATLGGIAHETALLYLNLFDELRRIAPPGKR